MPLYEYQCKKCGHRFEEIRKFSDKHLTKCRECGGALEQVLSAPAVQFKGSGWYVTDYAKKVSAPSASGDSGAKTDSKDKAESTGKKEEKPKAETSSKKTEKK